MDNRINIFDILKNESKLSTIIAYPAVTTINDPYEKTKSKTYLNPISVPCYLLDENFSSLKFKYYGEIPYGSKKILCALRYEKILKNSYKLQIENDYYSVYQDADKNFAILKRDSYLIIILVRKSNA